eukprot:973370-Amphidinium_carterae.1
MQHIDRVTTARQQLSAQARQRIFDWVLLCNFGSMAPTLGSSVYGIAERDELTRGRFQLGE